MSTTYDHDFESLNVKNERTKALILEGQKKIASLEVLRESYRVAQETRQAEIEKRQERLRDCAEIMQEMEVLLPKINALDVLGSIPSGKILTNAPIEVMRWKVLEDDFNRVYHSRGARRTTPMKWED